MSKIYRLREARREWLRNIVWGFKRRKLQNHDFSVISSNCLGCIVCHDLKQRYNSPTVNLFMPAEDYILFLENLREYLQPDTVIEDITNGNRYPIGLMNGKIHLHFVHYDSFDEAAKKWRERATRVNFDNLYVIMVERDGCTHEILQRFDRLDFKHKMVIVHDQYDDISCAYPMMQFKEEKEMPDISRRENGFRGSLYGRKIYENISWTDFLNQR